MPALSRRRLAGLLAACLPQRPVMAAPPERSTLLSMVELRGGERDTPDLVRRRLDLYRSLGCGGVRTALGWRDLEQREGAWKQDPRLAAYYALVAKADFRVKCQIGAVSSVPDWFFEKYPDARLLNQRGDFPHGYISPWYPGAPAILAEQTERVYAAAADLGVLDLADGIIVDLGPAGEPTYPAAWHIGHGATPGNATFWYFDPHAQRDFGRRMEAQYGGDLSKANRVWGTRFGRWAEVTPPVPNTIRGPIWTDLLHWYFDAKRALIAAQIETAVRLIAKKSPGRPIRPMLLLPGDHATPEDWALTASNGIGTYLVKIAADTEFVIDQAARHGCWLQYG